MKKEKPRFFCDHCGAEVDQAAEVCPECGRSFASVRCPHCGFTGGGEAFSKGCPGCGASLSSETPKAPALPAPKPAPPKPVPPPAGSPLPLWVYLITGAVFIGVLLALYWAVLSA